MLVLIKYSLIFAIAAKEISSCTYSHSANVTHLLKTTMYNNIAYKFHHFLLLHNDLSALVQTIDLVASLLTAVHIHYIATQWTEVVLARCFDSSY